MIMDKNVLPYSFFTWTNNSDLSCFNVFETYPGSFIYALYNDIHIRINKISCIVPNINIRIICMCVYNLCKQSTKKEKFIMNSIPKLRNTGNFMKYLIKGFVLKTSSKSIIFIKKLQLFYIQISISNCKIF